MSLTTFKLDPYLNENLNRLESLCTNTLTLMAYVGSFFLSGSTNHSVSMSLGVIALILNFSIYLLSGFYLMRSYFPSKLKLKEALSPQKELIPAKSLEIQSDLNILTSDLQFIFNSENDLLSVQREDVNSPMSASPDLDESSLGYDKFSPVLESNHQINNFSVLKNSGFANSPPQSPIKKLESNSLFRESSHPSARDHLIVLTSRESVTESPRGDLTKRESDRIVQKSPIISLFKTEKK